MSERIVAAAIKLGSVTLTMPPPARHGAIFRAFGEAVREPFPEFGEQGFITTSGRFVGRTEAYRIAGRAEQFLPGSVQRGDELFSEDLW